MKQKWKYLLGVLGLFFFIAHGVQAKGYDNPHEMIEAVAGKTFDRVNRDKLLIQADKQHYRVIVKEELMPYVDHRYAAFKVIGPEIRKTTPEQRSAFAEAFRLYTIATFAEAFTKYNNQRAEFGLPSPTEGKRIVTVDVKVFDGSRPPVSVQFKARSSKKTGEWKVFDMIAEGVSLLSAQQKEVGGLIRQKGIEAVTQDLLNKYGDGTK